MTLLAARRRIRRLPSVFEVVTSGECAELHPGVRRRAVRGRDLGPAHVLELVADAPVRMVEDPRVGGVAARDERRHRLGERRQTLDDPVRGTE
jgi:hypothetical protein